MAGKKGLYGSIEKLFFQKELRMLKLSDLILEDPNSDSPPEAAPLEATYKDMIRDSSPSTVANTNTPSSAADEHESPDSSLLTAMGPPTVRRDNLYTSDSSVKASSALRDSTPSTFQNPEGIQRPSSAPHEQFYFGNVEINPDPWNALRSSQNRAIEPWSSYWPYREHQSDSENTPRTKTRASRSVSSMDTAQDNPR